MNEILAHYLLETPNELERTISTIAGEQSSGTFLPVPGETPELIAKHRARIVRIEPLGSGDTPSLPGGRVPKGGEIPVYRKAKFTLAFPFENVGANLPTLLATVAGNLFELSDHSGLKLLDLDLPDEFAEAYAGPQFGIEGTRRLSGVYDRPLIGTIVKPSVGLPPEKTASLVKELCDGGIDFIKDDELMANSPHSPLKERVAAVMKVLNAHADKTGKKPMFAFNLTDDLEAMLRHHEEVLKAGGTCVMISLNSVGLPGADFLRRRCALPIHGHRNGWGMFTRHPLLGLGFSAYQKLWRTIGVDHLHVNGLRNKFWEPDESVIESVRSVLAPLHGGRRAMPVLSSGQTVHQPPDTYSQTGTRDVMYLAGGGVMAHPNGPGAGIIALRQSWEAAVAGIPLEIYADTRPELAAALDKYARVQG